MDIFNRPPAIAEDTLQYVIHPGPQYLDKASVATIATMIDSHVSSVLPNHIWHRDTFELKVVSEQENTAQWTIEGLMRVGDCVDDEWCVVWLLRDISKQWDVVVSVFDTDGEFLLIEAAEYLPAWVTPENSENRVWIYQGHLHLVPLQHVSSPTTKRERRRLPGAPGSDDEDGDVPGNDGEYISTLDAIRVVRDPKMDTLTSPDMENAAFRRIQGYPAVARQHVHRTKAYVPRDIALALSSNPALVQKATEAFYTRDSIQLRAATRMARFPPNTSVLATVEMTRPAYAQLLGQKFHPPRVFGQWNEREGTRERRWKDVGMKIACGFEMLYQETKGRHDVANPGTGGIESSTEARKEALRRDHDYTKYIQNLQGAGYFKHEAEGSALWKEQESRAAAQFIKSKQLDNANRPSFAFLVNSAVSQTQSGVGDSELSGFVRGEEESDEWLAIDEHTVEGMLTNSTRPETVAGPEGNEMDVDERKQSEDKVATEKAGQLGRLADKVEKFIEGKGDVEGATFEDDIISDGEDLSEFSDSDDDSTSNSRMDTGERAAAERQAVMDNLVPALDPSEYGQMPASFHANSQKVTEARIESQVVSVEEPSEVHSSPPPKPIRPLIFPRDQFDGVEDSDDESEEEGIDGNEEDEDEDRPTVVGEVEIDMQEEEEEFLQFSREALGISPEMWSGIVRDRKGRGAFLPSSAFLDEAVDTGTSPVSSAPKFRQAAADPRQGKSDSVPRPNGNPNLDSFEAVMQAMDAELSRAERNKQGGTTKSALPKQQQEVKSKGKQKAEDNDQGLELSMDAELRAALEDGSDEDGEDSSAEPMNYTLIKNFLESFKSQHGLSGPVGNLAGRLQPGWQMPRDEN